MAVTAPDLIFLVLGGLVLLRILTVSLDPVVQALCSHSQSLGNIQHGMASISDLLDGFDLEFFCITLPAHKHLL